MTENIEADKMLEEHNYEHPNEGCFVEFGLEQEEEVCGQEEK